MNTWQISEAESRFNELIKAATFLGPQFIVRDGTECAVVLSIANYQSLASRELTLRDYLLNGPKTESFEIPRDPDLGRDIEL